MQRYRTRVIEVDATRLTQHVTLEGGEKGNPGDWLVAGPDSQLAILTDKVFGRRFEPVSGAPAEQVTPERRRRGGRRPGPRPGSKRAKKQERSTRAARPALPPIVPVKAEKRARLTYTPDQMSAAKKLIESGKTIQETATQLGLKYGRVYTWAKANGWESQA